MFTLWYLYLGFEEYRLKYKQSTGAPSNKKPNSSNLLPQDSNDVPAVDKISNIHNIDPLKLESQNPQVTAPKNSETRSFIASEISGKVPNDPIKIISPGSCLDSTNLKTNLNSDKLLIDSEGVNKTKSDPTKVPTHPISIPERKQDNKTPISSVDKFFIGAKTVDNNENDGDSKILPNPEENKSSVNLDKTKKQETNVGKKNDIPSSNDKSTSPSTPKTDKSFSPSFLDIKPSPVKVEPKTASENSMDFLNNERELSSSFGNNEQSSKGSTPKQLLKNEPGQFKLGGKTNLDSRKNFSEINQDNDEKIVFGDFEADEEDKIIEISDDDDDSDSESTVIQPSRF